jgi:hypothetical protein
MPGPADDTATGHLSDSPAEVRGEPDGDGSTPLFPEAARDELRSRWEAIQAEFVDEPRHSVEEADRLVTETTKRLADSFADVRRDLEDEWKRGDDVSTEDLRLAFRRYRSFFSRLVSA